jgi:hypothetical protein
MLPSMLDVVIPAGLSTTITCWSSYKTGNGRPALEVFSEYNLKSIVSPGFKRYECNVTDLSFTRIVPLCNSFLILVLGVSGYCSIRNSNRVNDLFIVVFILSEVNCSSAEYIKIFPARSLISNLKEIDYL